MMAFTFGATEDEDHYAGYVVEDSDLEYSGCSDEQRLACGNSEEGYS